MPRIQYCRAASLAVACLLLAVGSTAAKGEAPNFLVQWGSFGSGPGQFYLPTAVVVDGNGFVYVADTGNNRIQKFDSSGSFMAQWGSYGSAPGRFNSPNGIAVDASGRVYVGDVYNNRVQVFDAAGGFLLSIGAAIPGTDSSITRPFGVAVEVDGSVYVANGWGDNYISKFTSDGRFIRRWSDQLSSPYDIAPDGHGILYILSSANSTVVATDTDGNLLRVFGQGEYVCNTLSGPIAIAMHYYGNLVVMDTNNNRVKVLTPSGGCVASWGEFGSLPGQFNDAHGIAVGPDGAIYVSDSRNNRIQKFNDAPVPTGASSWGSVKIRYR